MANSIRDLPRQAPGFVLYFFTAAFARMSNEGLKLGFVLAAADTAAGIKMGGFLVAAFLVPSIIAAPIVGRMADMSRRPTRLYAAAFAFNAVVIAAIALLLGRIPNILVLVIAGLGGIVGPLVLGGLSALIGTLVPPAVLPQAYAMDVVTYNVSAILAPAIVALVADATTPMMALLLLAALVGLSAAGVTRLPILRPEDRAHALPPAALDGFKAIARISPLRSTVVVTSANLMGLGVLPIAATLMAEDHVSVNAGVILSVMAVGSLVGSLSYAARPFGTDHPHRLLPAIVFITAIPLALLMFGPGTAITLVLFFITGALAGPQGTAQFSVRDRFSPTAVRTQVFTLSTSIKTTFGALGAALAGGFSGAPIAALIAFAVICNIVGAAISSIDLERHGFLRGIDPDQHEAHTAACIAPATGRGD